MKRVQVYRNVTKQCWSIREKGKVIAHANNVYLIGCKFHVGKSGRERVLREKRKNVHAWITGDLVLYGDFFQDEDVLSSRWAKVSYNPYKNDTFVTPGGEILKAMSVLFLGKDVWAR